mmetsp:Transcript_12265/g.14808  ORF Transcript_12265/g.14808 Transcript_12265/m.14808 type:complete len:631 (+) Transcript_12265:56-1948(+)
MPFQNQRPRTPILNPEDAFDPNRPSISSDIMRMISLYLESQGLHASAVVVADEAHLRRTEIASKRDQLQQLRRLILDADWESAGTLLLKTCARFSQRHCLYLLYRQEFLELVQTQQTQRALAFLNKRLKPLEGHLKERDGVEVKEGEFAELCYLLTCRSVRDSRLFSSWPGALRGRELLADEIVSMAQLEEEQFGVFANPTTTDESFSPQNKGLINDGSKDGSNPLHHLQGEGRRSEMSSDRLVKLLQQAVSFQVEFSRYRNSVARGEAPVAVTGLAADFECVAPPTATHEIFQGHKAGVKCLTFVGADASTIASSGSDSRILLWATDGDTGNAGKKEGNEPHVKKPLYELGGHTARVWDVASNRSGSHLSSVSANGVVNLWKIGKREGSLLASLNLRSNQQKVSGESESAGRFDDIYSVCWHPDGRHLVTGGHDRRVQILDIGRNMTVLKSLAGHHAAVVEVATNPTGNLIASASRDGTVRFWDAMSGLCVKTLGDQPGAIGEATSMRLSRDGSLALTSSRHGAIRLWDLRSTAKPLIRYKGHQNSASSFLRCSFGVRESVVMSGSDDGSIHIWDTASGKPLSILEGHSGAVYRCEWAGSKQSIAASSSEDGTIRTWCYKDTQEHSTSS